MLGDEKISFILMVPFGENEEFICPAMYMVKKEYRHKGYGKKTWDYAWAELPDSCLVSLSATIPQDLLYIQSGFKTSWNEHTILFDANIRLLIYPIPI